MPGMKKRGAKKLMKKPMKTQYGMGGKSASKPMYKRGGKTGYAKRKK